MIATNFPGPTWTSSHEYGEGVINHHKKLCYFHIPKCASMWMRDYLRRLGAQSDEPWVYCNFTRNDTAGYRPLILLRDPVTRWVSNCPAVDKIVQEAQVPAQIDHIFDNLAEWMQDEHSSPQSDFIAGLDLDQAVFFKCDKNLSRNVEHFLRQQGFDMPAPVPQNVSERSEQYVSATQAWRGILDTPKYQQVFQKYFAQDYELIQNVTFYRLGEHDGMV